ncbi:hypothetical protein ACP275_14G268100 [Erythranthe tilingii]
MRLIRSVLRPANISLSRQFQWCQVIKPSRTHLHPELMETSNLMHGSHIKWSGRSYAASAPSNTMEVKKSRRRVSKDERRYMVEKYFNKYMEMNAGKFPTVSDAVKDVGGSYYFVRQILQELIYNSKMSSMSTKDALVEKETLNKDAISTNFAEVSRTSKLQEIISPSSKLESTDPGSKTYELEQGPQSSVTVEANINDETQIFSAVSAKSEHVGTESHRSVDEPENCLAVDPQNNIRKETIHEDQLKFDGLQPKSEPQESIEVSGRELDEVPSKELEPQKKSSMWKNLKSFANEILDIWRRS